MRNILKRAAAAVMAVLLSVTCLGATSALADDGYSKTVTFNGVQTGDTVVAYQLVKYGDGAGSDYNTLSIAASFKTYLAAQEKFAGCTTDVDYAKKLEELDGESMRVLLKGYVNGWTQGSPEAAYAQQRKDSEQTSPQITFAPGYYLVLPSTTVDNSSLYNPLSVFVKVNGTTSTVSAAGNTIADGGSVEMKQEKGPALEKYVLRVSDNRLYKTKTVEVGDKVTYAVKITFPSYSNVGDPEFVLHDTMEHLSFGNDVKVYGATADGTMYDASNEIAGAITRSTSDGGELSFDLDYSKIAGSAAFTGEKTVYVVYTAEVQQSITDSFDADGRLSSANKAYLTYRTTAQAGATSKTNESTTSVFTYALNLEKINSQGVDLTGAAFRLTEVKGGQAASEPVWFKRVDEGANSYYIVVEKGTEGATQTVEASSGSGANELKIRGLDQYNDYLVEEVTTPNGFYAPAGTFTVHMASQLTGSEHTGGLDTSASTFTASNTADNGLVNGNKSTEGAVLSIQLKNSNMPSLPTTGGMGTALFTIGGVALMVAAAVAFVVVRRKSER